MTYVDPRGANVLSIPYPLTRNTIAAMREFGRRHPPTLPPVDADRFAGARYGAGTAHEDMILLEGELKDELGRLRELYPAWQPLDIVSVLLRVVRSLLREANLPRR